MKSMHAVVYGPGITKLQLSSQHKPIVFIIITIIERFIDSVENDGGLYASSLNNKTIT